MSRPNRTASIALGLGLELMIRIRLRQKLDVTPPLEAGAVQVTVVRIAPPLATDRREVDLSAAFVDRLDVKHQPIPMCDRVLEPTGLCVVQV